MGEVFRKAEAAIYLFAGLLVVLGAVYVLGEALVQGVGLFLGGGGSKVAVFLLDRVLLALMMAESPPRGCRSSPSPFRTPASRRFWRSFSSSPSWC